MGKLHETLAVIDSLESVYRQVIDEAKKTFKEKDHLFKGHQTDVEPLEEDMTAGERSELQAKCDSMKEVKEVAETVHGKLQYVLDHAARLFNAYAQREIGNTEARANLEVDGKVLIFDAPATLLLSLENKLKQLRDMVQLVPTNDQAKSWLATDKPYIFTHRPDMKLVTEKKMRFKVTVVAQDKHPAQVAQWTEDVPVAKKITTHFSGMVSPTVKSNLLAKFDKLINACKMSRQRANEHQIQDWQVGETITNYLLS